jgi:hypothetical protein
VLPPQLPRHGCCLPSLALRKQFDMGDTICITPYNIAGQPGACRNLEYIHTEFFPVLLEDYTGTRWACANAMSRVLSQRIATPHAMH